MEPDGPRGPRPAGPRRIPSRGPLTAGEVYLVEWGRESFKAAAPLLNDVLGKVLTLATALTGGGLALLDKAVVPGWAKVGMLTLFVGAVVACLAGLTPRAGVVPLTPDAVRRAEVGAIARKRRWLLAAGGCLVAGFAVAIVGVAVRTAAP